jgi:two-component system nitrogen regulation sensor histidine kinase GlnL
MDRELPKLVKGGYPRRVLDHLSTSVVVLDDELRLVYMNPAAEMLFAASMRQMLGVSVSDLLSECEAIVEGLGRCLTNGHPYTEREVQLGLNAGRRVTVDLTVTAMQEPEVPTELLMEMRHLDRRLRIAWEEHLISQYNTTRALVRGLAHEVKNPLGGIRGAAQLLEQDLDDPELREYTGIVIREADRLRKLVDRMLGPNALPRRKRCNVHEILEQVRALIEAEGHPNIVISRDYDPSIPPLWADPDQLVQAFLNIVRNAVEALEDGGVITVRTRVQRQCSIGPRRNKLVACIDIVDNGPGISHELMERIFLPMITTRSNGTGLGLSIAQNLVNQHQGLIECSSRPGETVFSVLLPVEKGDE